MHARNTAARGRFWSDVHGIGRIITAEYKPAVLEQAQSIALAGIGDRARRRIQYAGITVDGAESRDLDDGIWAERLSDGGYAMWVHISDVSAFIEPGSAIDADIHDRTTSVYGPGGVLAMMPHILSEQHLSLHPGSPKLAMTARIELAPDGRVRKFAFEDSVFTNIRRYHYENFAEDFLDPDSEHHDMLHLMREIADVRRAHRMSEGAAVNYDESDRRLSLVPGHERIITAAKSLPHHIIAEFMIAANEAAATYCYEAEAISLYRKHETLREMAYYTERPGAHTGLGLRLYTHFTSPIRRLADVIVHRAIRAVAEDKPAPHSHADVVRAGHHANFMREAIESSQRQARLEDRWEGAIDRIKARKDTVEFPDLTPYIRAHCALPYSRLPENVAAEIIRGIEHGPKGHWAWSVSTLLSSSHAGVKAALRKAVMKRQKLSPRAVLRILADTRWVSAQDERPWQVHEELSDGHVSVTVLLHERQIARASVECALVPEEGYTGHSWPEAAAVIALGEARAEAVGGIFAHFYGAQDMAAGTEDAEEVAAA